MKHKLRRQFTEEYREQQNSMKRIGLISDTHGTFDQTLKTFLKDVDEIWHAGDIGSPEVADQIAAFKPLRAVYGNIDGGIMRRTYREFLSFECEGVSVLMTHIGGYPRHYTPQAVARINRCARKSSSRGTPHSQGHLRPRLRPASPQPGAAGCYGFHKVRSALRFTIDGTDIRDMEIGEWPRPGA